MSNKNKGDKSKFRLAASLILIQKQVNNDGYELLMMKRSDGTSFKSVTVFPGGALDKVDALNYWKDFEFAKNITDEKEIKLTSLKLTAIRETFEEAGILLSKPQISLSGTEVKEWREKLEKRPEGFMEMCKYYDVSPDIDSLYYVSHWIPPTVVNKKFSTFFFAYLAPNPIVFHPPNTKGSQRELTSLEYKTPSKWLKLQRDEVIFFPPQFYTCSVLANSFPTWSAIESHLKTPPIGEHKTMASIIQLVDESKVDLKAFGVDPNNCDSVYYQIYPGDSQYNKDLDDVDYEPLLNNGKLNQNVKYHRILGIIEGLQLRDIKLITNLNVNKGRFLVYDDTSNFSSNKAKL